MNSILKETYTLSNGVKIPKLGLGTWLIEDKDAANAVRCALSIGYRLIDTAEAYENEVGVGIGVKTSSLPREEIFVTTKLKAECKTYKEAKEAIEESLEKLDLGYIDLMLIHSPQPWKEVNQSNNRYHKGNKEAWKALEEAYLEGKIKSIGVSNFMIDDLENIMGGAKVKPMVNQLLCHISNTPSSLIDYCKLNNILVESYSPIAHGEILNNPTLIDMAKKYNVSVARLCIRYTLQLGTVSLPKSENPAHIKSNSQVDFVISNEDMIKLENIDRIDNYGSFSHFPVYGGRL